MAYNMCGDVSCYIRKHFENLLPDHLQESLIVTSLPGKANILPFRKTLCEIIHSSWCDDKAVAEHTENIRFTSAVAESLASGIGAMPCEVNTYRSQRSLNVAGLQESVPRRSFSDRRHHRADRTSNTVNSKRPAKGGCDTTGYRRRDCALLLLVARLYSLRSASTCTERTALKITSISRMHSVFAVRTKRLVVISGRHCSVRRHFHQKRSLHSVCLWQR